VSSFGFSGTNAHLLLEQAPTPAPVERAADPVRPRHLLKLAAANDDALRQFASRFAETLASPDPPSLVDLAHTANVARANLARRAAVSASDAAEARAALEALAAGTTPESVRVGTAGQRPPRPAFLFTGQGAARST
jgi:acyl transferase domain-containing protein